MNKIFKTKIFPFLRIEVEGAAEVYYLQGSDFLLNLGGLETRIIISRLNFHIFHFSVADWFFEIPSLNLL